MNWKRIRLSDFGKIRHALLNLKVRHLEEIKLITRDTHYQCFYILMAVHWL